MGKDKKKPSSSRRRLRSDLNSSSSENNTPVSKRSTITRFMAAKSADSTAPLEESGEAINVSCQGMGPEEMRSILIDIQTKVGKILADNAALRKDIEELKSSMQQKDEQITTLSTAVTNLSIQSSDITGQIEQQRIYIQQLEERVNGLEYEHDSLEQYTRKYNVEIHGVPERSDENLPVLISSIAAALGTSIRGDDIDIVHRVYAKPPKVKPIIVRFKSYGKKQEFYQARFRLRDADLAAIIPGDNTERPTIYINENLTSRRKDLFGKAWKLKKDKNYHRLWTVDGKILLRKSAGDRAIRITDEEDLAKF